MCQNYRDTSKNIAIFLLNLCSIGIPSAAQMNYLGYEDNLLQMFLCCKKGRFDEEDDAEIFEVFCTTNFLNNYYC